MQIQSCFKVKVLDKHPTSRIISLHQISPHKPSGPTLNLQIHIYIHTYHVHLQVYGPGGADPADEPGRKWTHHETGTASAAQQTYVLHGRRRV